MNGTDKFGEALNAEMQKLQRDEQTQAGATALLDKYRDELRKIATSPARMGIRVERLGKADDQLLESLRGLSDTEQPDEVEVAPPDGQ